MEKNHKKHLEIEKKIRTTQQVGESRGNGLSREWLVGSLTEIIE